MGDRKTVLITGAAGFLGSHLCDKFINEGHNVIGLDNFLTGSMDNIAHLMGNNQFKFLEHNVTTNLYFVEDIDVVLHFACPASPVDYIKFPIQTLKVGSLGTYYTLGLSKVKGSRYVFASTSEVYGDAQVHPQSEDYWGNVNPIGPRSVYDEGKRFSEAMIMAYHKEHNIDTRIARIFNTFGERMMINDGRVVPNMIWQAVNNFDVTVYGDGKQTRSLSYIDDTVEAIYQMSIIDNLNGEVINIGNPDEYRIIDLAKLIIKLSKSTSKIVFKELPEDDPKRRKPDINKAKKLLGWKPRFPVKEGLKRTIDFIKNKYMKQ
jgi:dTDP-glucose 4,6-dehydratase